MNWITFFLLLQCVHKNVSLMKETCYAGYWEESPVYSPCPNITLSAVQQQHIGCTVSLGFKQKKLNDTLVTSTNPYINNQRCTDCAWKEMDDTMCIKQGKTADEYECCCRTVNCNKQLLDDSAIGWFQSSDPSGCKIAHFAVTDSSKIDVWRDLEKENYERINFLYRRDEVILDDTPSSNTRKQKKCILMITESIELISITLTVDNGICNKIEETHECDIEQVNNTKTRTCCCTDPYCNQKLYRKYGFERLQQHRTVQERNILQREHNRSSVLPANIWSIDETYFSIKPYIDFTIIVVTAFHFILMFYLYNRKTPIDMEKRPRPAAASSSTETLVK